MAASWNLLSDGLGFRGVVEEENTAMGERSGMYLASRSALGLRPSAAWPASGRSEPRGTGRTPTASPPIGSS
jgi:hypothetical protein